MSYQSQTTFFRCPSRYDLSSRKDLIPVIQAKKTRYESGFLFLETLNDLESFQSGNVY